jgi:hypothetical protein
MPPLRDLILAPSASPGKTCGASDLMMARARANGIFELLSASAWTSALGYGLEELSGKSLCDLMPVDKRVAGDLVAALLDLNNEVQSVEIILRCKDERRKSFRFHRQFDPYGDTMYFVADDLSGPTSIGR